MESAIPVFLHMEVSEPKRRIIRNDAALYLVLLFGAIGCIALSRWLSARFGVMRLAFQILLYAALFGIGYALYRLRLAFYRYTLTSAELTVAQIVGRKETKLCEVPLCSITSLGTWVDGSGVYDGRTFTGRRRDALCIYYKKEAESHVLCLSASESLRTLLQKQINPENGAKESAV